MTPPAEVKPLKPYQPRYDEAGQPIRGFGRRATDVELRQRIPMGALVVSILALAGSIFLFGLRQENRLTKLEEGLITEHQVNQAQDAAMVRRDADAQAQRSEFMQILLRIEDRQIKKEGR